MRLKRFWGRFWQGRAQSPLAPKPPLPEPSPWYRVRVFLEMIKFEHSLFALPFAYLGLFLAEEGLPRPFLFLWITVAMVSFRTFAMAANRLIDRKIDAKNPRTKNRALPQGKLTPRFVWASLAISVAIFLWSAWRLGPLCFSLSPIPILLAWIYPYLKRFTWLSHICLGIILGIAPYGAWLASRGDFGWTPAFLLIGVASWVAGFDILYSLQDKEFDRAFRIRSVPADLGEKKALWLAGLLHLTAVSAWAGAGALAERGWIYGLGMLLVTLFLLREHRLVHRFGVEKIEEAFFKMNVGVSSSVFLATLLDLGWRR